MKNLFKMTEEMASCNGFEIKQFKDWPKIDGYDLTLLDTQASRLRGDQMNAFADGSEEEIAELKRVHNLNELDAFLNDVFGGELHFRLALN